MKPKTQIYENDAVRPVWKEIWKKREDALRNRFAKQLDTLNAKTHELPQLNIGDLCRIQKQTDRFPKKWDKTGRIVQAGDNNQYVVKVEGSGRLTLCNRKYLRKVQPLINSTHRCTVPYSTKSSREAPARSPIHYLEPVKQVEMLPTVSPGRHAPVHEMSFDDKEFHETSLQPQYTSTPKQVVRTPLHRTLLPGALSHETHAADPSSSQLNMSTPNTQTQTQSSSPSSMSTENGRPTRVRKTPGWCKDQMSALTTTAHDLAPITRRGRGRQNHSLNF